MMRILRVLGLFLFASLLFWLWYDAQPKHKIESGLRHAYIGGLTKAEEEAFSEALRFVTSGVKPGGISVALNKPGLSTAIQVLTITDAGSVEFHCGPGNAAYDPHLDAILVHVDLVRAWLAPEYAATELFSPRKAFFIFLLLHELGHRAKHGSTRNMYGAMASEGDRHLEEEADQYSFDEIEGLAQHPLVIQPGSHSALAEAWKLHPGSFFLFNFDFVPDTLQPGDQKPDPRLNAKIANDLLERTAKLRAQPLPVRRDLFLLSLLHALPRAAMRGDSPYSSLHEDRAHPTLVSRFKILLDNYRNSTSGLTYPRDPEGMWAARSDGLAAVAEQIELLNRMQSSPVAEITAPTAIASLAWKDSNLLILASDGRVYAIDRKEMRGDSSRSSLTGILLKPADAIVQPGPHTQWSTIQSELWTGSDGQIYTYTDSGVLEADHGLWTKIKAGPFANLSILSIARASSSSMMTIWTGDLLKITDPANPVEPTDSELIVIKNGDTIAARRSLSQLQADVVSRAGQELETLDTAAVNRDGIWLSMWSVDDTLLGLAAFDPQNLHFLRSIKIHSPKPISKDSSAIAIGDSGQVVITVSAESSIEPKAGVHLDPVEIFSVTATGTLDKRGSIPIPFSRVVALSPELPEPVIGEVQFLDKDELLVNSHSWSPNFVFNLTDGNSRPLFFPSTSLNATNSKAEIAFVPLSGGEASLGIDPGGNYRCYVLASPLR
jgi:hypothetical protein